MRLSRLPLTAHFAVWLDFAHPTDLCWLPDALQVGNLSWTITEDALKAAFSDCGEITRIKWIERDGEFKGTGFVDFETVEAATKAVAMAGTDVAGRPIREYRGIQPHTACACFPSPTPLGPVQPVSSDPTRILSPPLPSVHPDRHQLFQGKERRRRQAGMGGGVRPHRAPLQACRPQAGRLHRDLLWQPAVDHH